VLTRWPVVWAVVLSVVCLGPALSPGYILSYDMVFVPRQQFLPATLGLGDALPRAVPADAVVALLTQAIPGQWLQKLILLAALTAAGVGAARLVPVSLLSPGAALPAELAAATAYVWNPYVAERLVIGHWALLVSYACLPWLARTAGSSNCRGYRGKLTLLLALTAITPTGGLIGAAVALTASLAAPAVNRWRSLGWVALVAVVVNAPWWVAAVTNPAAVHSSDPAGMAAFASRSESSLGMVWTLLSLGGIWNAEVAPTSRSTIATAVVTAMVGVICGVGALSAARYGSRRAVGWWAGLAGLGVALAAAGATPVGLSLLTAAVPIVPGIGLLRDGHKFLALWSLPLACCFGLGVGRFVGCLTRWYQRNWRGYGPLASMGMALWTALLVALPVAVIPDAAWGVSGRLSPVAYPRSWKHMRDSLDADPRPGDVVSLPWQPYRSYPWNRYRTVLDPLPRYVSRTVIVDDSLPLMDRSVRGESRRADRVRSALTGDTPLAQTLPPLGIGWVVRATDTPGDSLSPDRTFGWETVLTVDGLQLLRIPGEPKPAPRARYRSVVIAVDIGVIAIVIAAGVGTVAGGLVAGGSRLLLGQRRRRLLP
jgi:hypothetical protein